MLVVALGAAAALLLGGGSASAGGSAQITNVAVSGANYQVWFETDDFAPSESGQRLHFFWNTVSPENAGEPGDGPWTPYWGASPVVLSATSQRPASATQLCVLVANSEGEVRKGSGNCWTVPR